MIELKTLKDIETGYVDTGWIYGEATEGYTAVDRDELRQEAIKWIKNLKQDFPDYPNSGCEPIRWIEHFFNITEEDLK